MKIENVEGTEISLRNWSRGSPSHVLKKIFRESRRIEEIVFETFTFLSL